MFLKGYYGLQSMKSSLEPLQAHQALESFLLANSLVRFVRLHWLDFSGVLRTRFLSKHVCVQLAAGERCYGVGPAGMLFTLADTSGPPLYQSLLELRPDWSSVRLCGFRPTHASVMCFVRHKDQEDPYSQCPRYLLSQILEKSSENAVAFKVGFEVEFVLLDSSGCVPNDIDKPGAWSTTAGLRGASLAILEEISLALEASDIQVYHFHTEIPPQFELALEPLPPMQAIDCLLQTQETIKHICVNHGLSATMSPKPLLDHDIFSSTHMHLSVSPSDAEEQFLAGLLQYLPQICAFGMASYDSYLRVGDRMDTTGAWISWGTENRDVPIRKIEKARWELRTVDATANYYLLLATTIALGLRGQKENYELRHQDCRFYPSRLSEEERLSLGIDTRLPSSLREAVDSLGEVPELNEIIGYSMLALYKRVKDLDWKAFECMTKEARRQHYLAVF